MYTCPSRSIYFVCFVLVAYFLVYTARKVEAVYPCTIQKVEVNVTLTFTHAIMLG